MKWFLGIFDLNGRYLENEIVGSYNELEKPQNAEVENTTVFDGDAACFMTSVKGIYINNKVVNLNQYYIFGDIRIDNRKEIVRKYNLDVDYYKNDELIFLYLYRTIGIEFLGQSSASSLL